MSRSSQSDLPFLVVGGGIGGLATAVALARKGFSVHVLEQAPEFAEVGAGIQLGPNMFRALRKLGLRDAVLADAWLPNNMEMRDALSGDLVTRLPLKPEIEARFGEPYAVTHRADIHRAILEGASSYESIKLSTNSKLVDFRDEGNFVSAQLATGERLKGRALIGADGLWSGVREFVCGDGAPRVSGHVAYRAVLPRAEVPENLWEPDVVLWAGPKTHLVHYPLRRGELFNLVAVFHSDHYVEGWNAVADPEELLQRFAGQQSAVLSLLNRIETWRMWVLCDREPVAKWSVGNIVLVGDAAHPMLQYLAQGAAMAVEDASCLADAVAADIGDLPAAFSAYQHKRYLRTGRVQVLARVYGEFYHADGVVRELRNAMLGERTLEAAYSGMSWLYGGD